MPTLHAHSDASGYFARASLHGRAVVFQLSAAAAQRLTGAGLADGSRLSQQLLLALIQSGDAYTRPDAGSQSDAHQTALPFGESGKSGNQSLREALGWDEGTYDAVKANLLAGGQLIPGKGRGGSVAVV
jgi:hypothetical protein